LPVPIFSPWPSAPYGEPGSIFVPATHGLLTGENYPVASLGTDINRVRTFVRDWPTLDALTASTTSTATSVTVTDATTAVYNANWIIQIDQEAMLVKSGTGTALTVVRGARGTTAATHVNAAPILIRPGFLDSEIIDHLNAASDACYPYIYKEVIDTSLTILANTYEYTIPYLPTTTVFIPMLSQVELKESGDFAYRPTRRWEIRRGATPKLKFFELLPVGTVVRIRGYGPFPHRAALTDSMDAQWPSQADQLCTLYAASQLLSSGEAGRVRTDVGARDDREAANRAGSSAAAAQGLYQRFQLQLDSAQMPPMPRHCVATM
jgi:hypothetical protein